MFQPVNAFSSVALEVESPGVGRVTVGRPGTRLLKRNFTMKVSDDFATIVPA